VDLIINYFKKKHAVLIFLITFLIYSPLLFNQFIGDDGFIIQNNTFYTSWKNVPRLFENGYISDSEKIISSRKSKEDFGTGSVSYRPASNFTYFFDYYLFQAKPYGSHLINILIHCVNSVLVYWIVNQIFSSSILGLFAGLFFSLHPIQSEAVAVMSYRADIFATMFVLLSFYFWIRFTQGGHVRRNYYYWSLAMCFFALFSKESSFMLPLMILLFDQVLITPRPSLKQKGIYYIGFIPILIFYLYLYFVVFPNTSLSFHWLGGTFVNHCLIMGFIWYNYLVNALLPWTVKLIPGLYCPPVPGIAVTIQIGIALVILIISVWVLWRNYKETCFFLLWYIIFYLPVSNLIPIANPMADRFMYLPSIVLLVAVAFFLSRMFKSNYIQDLSQYLSRILYAAVILICVTGTLFLNVDWKSNYNVAYAWVRDYPTAYQGYAFMAKQYYYAKLYEKAEEYFEKSIQLGNRQTEDAIGLAECYIYFGKIDKAEGFFKIIISHHTWDDDIAFLYLGEIYYNQKKNLLAEEVLTKSLALNPNEPLGYIYLMKVYLNLQKIEAAKNLLGKANLYLNKKNISELRNALENHSK